MTKTKVAPFYLGHSVVYKYILVCKLLADVPDVARQEYPVLVFHISTIFQPQKSLFSGQTTAYDKNNHIFEIYINNGIISNSCEGGV